MLVLDELQYSEEHIWVRFEENHTVTLGITDFAQLQLGKLNYVLLPNEGDEIVINEAFGCVECGRLVNDLYAPVCGRVVSVNREVIDDPTLINYSPYAEGWIIRAKLSSLDELDMLMSSDDYEEYILTNYFPS
ncbi:MAG: glycine cleavage system protein GcvH [Deltaproteobacteria bacterium]|nr:glycine cleavage system protein GcvH [Deltaproteobacteria bacterium]MBW2019294.1 glycine cleavage system protein GcvH [Deltaproteobacteria bacterium]MBW2074085.1 glycine cleavage system protein GcvH [Deltaproteobacteria bacterium]RLB82585.1 MAG: glycine cleavage system protein GcvH [Deltaproteobacteria bacterium]